MKTGMIMLTQLEKKSKDIKILYDLPKIYVFLVKVDFCHFTHNGEIGNPGIKK